MSGMLNSLLSSIDPSAAPKAPTPGDRRTPTTTTPQPLPRIAGNSSGNSQTQPLKRKADGQAEGGQIKIQRKDGTTAIRADAQPTSSTETARPKSVIPYRGTAGNGGIATVKAPNAVVKKPNPVSNAPVQAFKQTAPTSTSVGVAASLGPVPASAKRGSYAAMLQRAKEAQLAKPAAPPIKHEPTKILTKKEREALRAGSSANPKGKKPIVSIPAAAQGPNKTGDAKEKRKPAELGYTGTARPPPKKAADIGYKGTARPTSGTPQPSSKLGASASAKAKSKAQARYSGYANWSDLDEEDEEEGDYDSEGSSDMEGGMWDVENEEAMALKAAKAEDAKALAEENEHRRQKEERKRKLMALNKAAAGKRKY